MNRFIVRLVLSLCAISGSISFQGCKNGTGPEQQKLTVSIVSPEDYATVSRSVRIDAITSDESATQAVTFSIDGENVFTDSDPMWQYHWDTRSLSDGEHTISVTATDGSHRVAAASVTVTVDNTSSGTSLTASPQALAFLSMESTKQLSLSRSGSGVITWSATTSEPWMSVSPAGGIMTTSTSLSVSIDRSNLTEPQYSGTVDIATKTGETLSVEVTVYVEQSGTPTLTVQPQTLSFSTSESQKSLTLGISGPGRVSWTASSDRSWLQLGSTSGTTPDLSRVFVTVDRSGLQPGNNTANIRFSPSSGGVIVVPVTAVVGGGQAATIVIENKLVAAVNIAVNGSVVGSVPASDTRSYNVGTLAALDLSWTLVRSTTNQGMPVGDQITGTFNTVHNPSGTLRYIISNVFTGNTWIFAPLITNSTASNLLMGVNVGLQSENRCSCLAPAYTNRVMFGYYWLYTNTTVRAYRENSNYTGPYLYWSYGTTFTTAHLASGSGVIEFTASQAPFTGPSPGSVHAAMRKAAAPRNANERIITEQTLRSGVDYPDAPELPK